MLRLSLVFGAVLALAGSSAAADRHSYAFPTPSPDGKRIAFVDLDTAPGSRAGGLYVARRDGSHMRRLLPGRDVRWPDWSPSGRKLAVTVGGNVVTLYADGGHVRTIGKGAWPAWSPSGRRIAYAAEGPSGRWQIYVEAADGRRSTVVARPPPRNIYLMPTWSPDGQRLAFAIEPYYEEDDAPIGLGIISSYRGRVRRLLGDTVPVYADWSPDGTRIAYSNGATIISVLNFSIGFAQDLGPAGDYARWMPDNRHLLFSDNGRLYVMDSTGRHRRAIVPHA